VYAPVYVFRGMIDNLTRVTCGESFVGFEDIGVESRTSFYMLANMRLQFMLLTIGYDRKPRTFPPRSKMPIPAFLSLIPVPVMRRLALFRR
jgi:hypothetical protein